MSVFKVFTFGRVMNDKDFHTHEVVQILKVDSGSMRLLTPERTWFVPRDHLILIPARTPHRAASKKKACGWSVFIDAGRRAAFKEVTALETSSLLESLIRSMNEDSQILKDKAAMKAYEALCLREIEKLKPEELFIPMPEDERLSEIAKKVIRHPNKQKKVTYWAKKAGMSERNFSRRFNGSVGMSFEKWRILAIHRNAIEKLSNGSDVSTVAYDLGYESPSSFIQSFKRINGETPGRYLYSKYNH